MYLSCFGIVARDSKVRLDDDDLLVREAELVYELIVVGYLQLRGEGGRGGEGRGGEGRGGREGERYHRCANPLLVLLPVNNVPISQRFPSAPAPRSPPASPQSSYAPTVYSHWNGTRVVQSAKFKVHQH